jgi:hypothetical protein
MQHGFDLSRLGSSMWQMYRESFNDKIKRGVKGTDGHEKPARTEWESKYEHPEAYQMNKTKFLHLPRQEMGRDFGLQTTNRARGPSLCPILSRQIEIEIWIEEFEMVLRKFQG